MLPLTTILARLTWAALLGTVIGLERNLSRRPAGMRTSLAVCAGAALFTIMSVLIAHDTGDTGTTRIASNIVQGIGFLGAGVILRERGSVVGLTTAAAIFVEAAIGMAAGAGYYYVSGFACLLVLIALVVLIRIENRFNLRPRYMLFRITTDPNTDLTSDIHQIFRNFGIPLNDLLISMVGDKRVMQFDADVSHHQQEKIFASIVRPGISAEMLPVERRGE